MASRLEIESLSRSWLSLGLPTPTPVTGRVEVSFDIVGHVEVRWRSFWLMETVIVVVENVVVENVENVETLRWLRWLRWLR